LCYRLYRVWYVVESDDCVRTSLSVVIRESRRCSVTNSHYADSVSTTKLWCHIDCGRIIDCTSSRTRGIKSLTLKSNC